MSWNRIWRYDKIFPITSYDRSWVQRSANTFQNVYSSTVGGDTSREIILYLQIEIQEEEDEIAEENEEKQY